jgi:hypothetical protein
MKTSEGQTSTWLIENTTSTKFKVFLTPGKDIHNAGRLTETHKSNHLSDEKSFLCSGDFSPSENAQMPIMGSEIQKTTFGESDTLMELDHEEIYPKTARSQVCQHSIAEIPNQSEREDRISNMEEVKIKRDKDSSLIVEDIQTPSTPSSPKLAPTNPEPSVKNLLSGEVFDWEDQSATSELISKHFDELHKAITNSK